MYSNQKTILNPSEVDKLLSKDYKFIKSNKGISYMNVPVAFDIETTSFYDVNGNKASIMYAWVFGINGLCIIGRTWDEFKLVLKRVTEYYDLRDNKRIVCFVHNLAFEFQYLSKQFEWSNVFATDERKPVYAVTGGIEFRCSYILSGYSLAMVGKNLVKYKVDKMVGDLDYSLIRHNKTPLTDKEYGYILNDGLVVMSYIQELIEEYGDLHKIPLTQTGFVRKYVRCECLYGGIKSHKKNPSTKQYRKYRDLMSTCLIPSYPSYLQMKANYTGGFTHCNALYNGVVIDDVTSYDFSSSYPAVMVMEKYPMSTPKLVDVKCLEDFEEMLKYKCCMFNITFYNIRPKLFQDHPISYSKCLQSEGVEEDNGRVVKARMITLVLNEVDFSVINDFYEWDNISVWNMRIMEKGYLPTPFVKAILKLYVDKTALKGLDDIENLTRYMHSKQNLNGCYGMCVTDVLQLNHTYKDGLWVNETPNIKEVFDKYNNNKSRFLFYPWGVWVTSYARKNLFMGIQAFGRDYIYSDTDSCKIRNASKHIEWIDAYNRLVDYKLEKACKWHNIDISMVKPKTIKGREKVIGYWDFDGHYKRFKTLG